MNDFDDSDGGAIKPPLKVGDKIDLAKLALKRARDLLPRGTASAGTRRGDRSPLRLNRRGEQPRVLLVDDDEVIRRLMGKIITGLGMACTAVESSEDAIPVMETELFDALVLDKNLPGIDGVELAGLARRIQPGVPVLMITGYSSEESARQAAAYGVADYILKPIDLADFRQRLSQVLADTPSRPSLAATPAEPTDPRATPRSASPPAAAMILEEPFVDDTPHEASALEECPVEERVSVLLVEPEHTVRGKLAAALLPMGCVIESYSEPTEVRLQVGKHPFELLVASPEVLSASREWIPDSGGWTLLGSIAIMERGGVDKAIEAIHLGARGVVHPPFEPAETATEFQRVVRALLEERRG